MQTESFSIQGPKLFRLHKIGDERGFFCERFRQDLFSEILPGVKFCQENYSRSQAGTLRGLHYQHNLPQSKLVTVTHGQVQDVIVDVRLGSATYGQSLSVILDGNHPAWFWIPYGFAHGLCVLGEEPADILYKVDNYYNPKGVGGLRWSDPALGINWTTTPSIISPRDQLLPFYRATRPRGYLGWGKSHQLGTGLGLTIGAKVAAPDKFCVNFMGDSAFGMVGLDFETAVRAGIPILTIVLNNSTMAIEIPHMKLSHERYKSRDLGGNYANLARELGGWSERVTEPGDIGNAILRARRQTEEGRPALLEFITSAETAFSHRNGRPE